MLTFCIDTEDQGKRLDVFLRENIEGFSAKKLKKLLLLFSCKINGKFERFASYRLKKGDKISFNNTLSVDSKLTCDSSHLLFEDDDYLIINKPAQLVCDELSIRRFLDKDYFLAHRLDKQTTGVLIIAKNSRSLNSITDLFRNRKIAKTYLCIVEGLVKQTTFSSTASLKKIMSFDGGGKWMSHAKGLKAQTDFKKIDSSNRFSLLKSFPLTGRTHQIRAHLSELGFPICGDYLYGAQQEENYLRRFMLHSLSIKFIHPQTKKEIYVKVDPPHDFMDTLAKLNLKL